MNSAKEEFETLLGIKWNKGMAPQDNSCQQGGNGRGSLTTAMAVYSNRKVLREDGIGRLNMILNSDIPRDLRLFILPDLKIVRILSKSQKQLSSRTSTAALTTMLRWGKLAGRGSTAVESQWDEKIGEYKALIKSKRWDFGGNSASVFTFI